ncbi:MAG TPA: hypothetical protein VLG69_04805 [Candidatus Andersenbacteria bacterium]|nr:hypothetical protein [Candidatus Andersenbacteria bacterium]
MEAQEFKKILDEEVKSIENAIDSKLDERFAQQDVKFEKILDNRFTEQDKKLEKTLDERFADQDTKIEQRFVEQSKKIDKRFEEQEKQMERYVGVVTEDYQSKLTASLEVFTPLLSLPQEIRSISEKLDDIKDAQHALRVTDVDHEKRIKVLEN